MKSVVYFLQRQNGDIKIGVSKVYQQRVQALQTEHGKLKLLGLIEGDKALEQELHKRFATYRRGYTEFFAPNQTVLRYIEDHTSTQLPLPTPIPVKTVPINIKDDLKLAIRLVVAEISRREWRTNRVTEGEIVRLALEKTFPEQCAAAARAFENKTKQSQSSI